MNGDDNKCTCPIQFIMISITNSKALSDLNSLFFHFEYKSYNEKHETN